MSNASALGLTNPPPNTIISSAPLGSSPLTTDQQAQVQAAQSLTAPLPTTEIETYSYYQSAISDCGIHRNDGKRLSFIRHFFRTNIQEDITFLDKEIAANHPLIRKATAAEVNDARAIFDPKGAQVERVLSEQFGETSVEAIRNKLLAEVREQIEADVLARMKATSLGGVDSVVTEDGTKLSGSAAASQLPFGALQQGVPLLKPLSTAQINQAAAGGAK